MPQDKKWTEQDVQSIITNPVYCVSDNPIISREAYIAANIRVIADIGAEAWINQILDHLDGLISVSRTQG